MHTVDIRALRVEVRVQCVRASAGRAPIACLWSGVACGCTRPGSDGLALLWRACESAGILRARRSCKPKRLCRRRELHRRRLCGVSRTAICDAANSCRCWRREGTATVGTAARACNSDICRLRSAISACCRSDDVLSAVPLALPPLRSLERRSSPAAGSAGLGGVTALPGLEAAEASADGGFSAVMCCGCALKPAVAPPKADFAWSAS